MLFTKKLSLWLFVVSCFFIYIGYVIFIGVSFIESRVSLNIIRVISLALILVSIYMNKRKVIYHGLLLSLLFLSLFIINGNAILINFVFIVWFAIACKSFNANSLLHFLLWTCLIVCFFHLILFYSGLLGSEKYTVGGRERYVFGFGNPNALALCYMSLVYLIASRLTIKYYHYIIMAGSLLIVWLSDSRTVFYGFVIYIFLSAASKIPAVSFLLRKLTVLSPFIFFCISLSLVTLHDSPLNEVMSLRPSLFKVYLEKIDYTGILIGRGYLNTEVVDNSYLVLLGACGAPITIIVLGIISFMISKTIGRYIPFIFVLLVSSMFETFLLRPEIPLTMLFFIMLTANPDNKCNAHCA